MNHFAKNLRIRNLSVLRSFVGHQGLREVLGPLQSCSFQTDYVPRADYVPRDPKSKPIKYKYPAFYDPYGPPPPPSEKIIRLADRIAALPPEERKMIRHTLVYRLNLPKMQSISVEGVDMGPGSGPSKVEEKKAEKTAFDVKLEKFDDASKLKVIIEVRAITGLGLKEAKDLVAKAPVTIKQGLTREEANHIIDKIKAAGGVAVTE